MVILVTLIAYFIILLLLGKVTAGRATNSTFYSADRRSPWGMVAFGMIGASVSGVTFVSVPGMVIGQDMTYLQTCLGFIIGYFIVAFVLLPLYYRMATPSIYSLLSARIGRRAYKSGAAFFLLSELTGASLKFYVACIVLQRFVLDEYGVPFFLTVPALMLLIWLYTRRGGIRTLVVTDAFQTAAMLAAVALIVYVAADRLGLTVGQAARAVAASGHARIFEFADFMSPQNFWKQFVSGAFIVIVMTGLNQTIMQKNLTCKTLGEARKDMCTYAFAFVPVNLLFLSLGVLLLMLAQKEGCAAPAQPDELLPMFAATGRLGTVVTVLFVIGVVAASADHHALRRRHRPARRRTPAPPRPPRHGLRRLRLHHGLPLRLVRQPDRRRLHARLLHLRPTARPLRLLAFHSREAVARRPRRRRPPRALRLLRRPPAVSRRERGRLTPHALPLRLRAPAAQRPHYAGYTMFKSCKSKKVKK